MSLCDPMDCSPPGSSVHGIPQARILEWVAMPSCRGSSLLRDRTWLSYVSCIRGSLPLVPPGKWSCSVMSDSLPLHGLSATRLLLSVEFFRQEYWSGLPFTSPGDLPDPGIKPRSHALQADPLPPEPQPVPPGKPLTKLDSVLKSRDITLPTKVHIAKLWFFQ